MAACVLIVFSSSCACAEALDARWLQKAGFEKWEAFSAGQGFDAAATLRAIVAGELGDASTLVQTILDQITASAHNMLSKLLVNLFAPVVLCASLRLILNGQYASVKMVDLLCTLCCALALGEHVVAGREIATRFLSLMNDAGRVLMPVLVSAAALTGAPTAATIMTPLAAECAGLIDHVLKSWGMGLCMAGVGVAMACSLTPDFPLTRLFALIKSLLRWMMGLSMFLFGLLMSARGLICAASDSAASQTARSLIETLIPVIGGEVSGAAGSLVASARVVRQALGLTGAAFVLSVCAGPLARLGGGALCMKLCAAVLEPVAGNVPAVGLIVRLGEIQELLMALCACAAVVTLLMTGGSALLLSNIF